MTSPPSLEVANAAMSFVSGLATTECILFHRIIAHVRRVGINVPREGSVRGVPNLDGQGRLVFRIVLGGRDCHAVVSALLALVGVRWFEGSNEIEEDDWGSIYDTCLSYMDANVESLALLGFDTSELARQRAVAVGRGFGEVDQG